MECKPFAIRSLLLPGTSQSEFVNAKVFIAKIAGKNLDYPNSYLKKKNAKEI